MLAKTNEPEPLLYSAREAARQLGISTRTLYSMERDGALRSVRIGRRVLYPRQALVEVCAGVPSKGVSDAK